MPGTTTSDKVLASFLEGKPRQVRNDSCTVTDSGIVQLRLHGNIIAQKFINGVIYGTLAGWPTVTTRDRLNALCTAIHIGRGFSQMNHVQYYGGEEIHPSESILLRSSVRRIAKHRKGLRLPKGYTFEECEWNNHISVETRRDGNFAGLDSMFGEYRDQDKKNLLSLAKSTAKDRLAAERARTEMLTGGASPYEGI